MQIINNDNTDFILLELYKYIITQYIMANNILIAILFKDKNSYPNKFDTIPSATTRPSITNRYLFFKYFKLIKLSYAIIIKKNENMNEFLYKNPFGESNPCQTIFNIFIQKLDIIIHITTNVLIFFLLLMLFIKK